MDVSFETARRIVTVGLLGLVLFPYYSYLFLRFDQDKVARMDDAFQKSEFYTRYNGLVDFLVDMMFYVLRSIRRFSFSCYK